MDGTITRSDVIGHILPMFGRDWSHEGVASLYAAIAANGYQLLYLTSRNIGMSDRTKQYLSDLTQEGFSLSAGSSNHVARSVAPIDHERLQAKSQFKTGLCVIFCTFFPAIAPILSMPLLK